MCVIIGFSMGGFGVLCIVFDWFDIFGVVGSISGVVDLCCCMEELGIVYVFGDFDCYLLFWNCNVIVESVWLFVCVYFDLMIDCGCDDVFVGLNCILYEWFVVFGVLYDYVEWLGGYMWDYWVNVICY